MKWLLLALALLTCAATTASAQTISPVIQEYSEKADGRFQLYNDTDVPLTVVVEPHSFAVDSTGKATFRKLDPDVHVQLSATSFRLAPRQTYFVFYKATADKLPNWFCIYATVTGTTTASGIKLSLELPHTVYLLTHKQAAQSDVVLVKAQSIGDGDGKMISGEIENHGSDFTRIQEVEVTSAAGKQVFPGFPLFPAQHRAFDLEWQQPGTPSHIVFKLKTFKIESGLPLNHP
jgi:hypothetical protein